MSATVVRVWDLPTRLFHWVLVALIALQYATGQFGLLSMQWHYLCGYATLALIVFRVLWGFFGSDTSRFSHFVRNPFVVLHYLRGLISGDARRKAGHNPLGGWSVLVMLALVSLQAVSGLFTTDDVTEDGPLVARVSDAAITLMTSLHHTTRYLLLALIALHVCAVALHYGWRKENLVAPMFDGCAPVDGVPALRFVSVWRAVVLLLMSAAAVWALVAWGEAA
ncbi:MAG: cytochrome b/b6 domain-containing protein [Dokdonella sp.]|uniref:cytochrome b/b6 domain-containing protein n=1 Tax=Dokdonella sp. TaxID=2291710 RepID=UPI003264DF9E